MAESKLGSIHGHVDVVSHVQSRVHVLFIEVRYPVSMEYVNGMRLDTLIPHFTTTAHPLKPCHYLLKEILLSTLHILRTHLHTIVILLNTFVD